MITKTNEDEKIFVEKTSDNTITTNVTDDDPTKTMLILVKVKDDDVDDDDKEHNKTLSVAKRELNDRKARGHSRTRLNSKSRNQAASAYYFLNMQNEKPSGVFNGRRSRDVDNNGKISNSIVVEDKAPSSPLSVVKEPLSNRRARAHGRSRVGQQSKSRNQAAAAYYMLNMQNNKPSRGSGGRKRRQTDSTGKLSSFKNESFLHLLVI